MRKFFFRLYFIFKYKTLRKKILIGKDEIIVCGSTTESKIPKVCPHQGADLRNAKIRGDYLVCHFHPLYHILESHLYNQNHYNYNFCCISDTRLNSSFRSANTKTLLGLIDACSKIIVV